MRRLMKSGQGANFAASRWVDCAPRRGKLEAWHSKVPQLLSMRELRKGRSWQDFSPHESPFLHPYNRGSNCLENIVGFIGEERGSCM